MATIIRGGKVANSADYGRIIRELGQEFLVETADNLEDLTQLVGAVRTGNVDASSGLMDIRRVTHNMKGMGASFGFPSITLVSHRLEDYLTGLATLDSRHLDDVQAFFDAMQDIVEAGENPSNDDLARVVRRLPAKGSADAAFKAISHHEVLLVASSAVLGLAVEAQLHSRGYRVVTVKTPIDAFEMVIRTRPDMIIASAVMEGVSGIDLARAFGAMTTTRDIPFVLLTSFTRSHPELKDLPETSALIHHDRDLDAEVSSVLESSGLLAA
jgi:CheY-like chemotaxis protein/HPt (histidine-containing phosphotransfer) domain-containing protein